MKNQRYTHNRHIALPVTAPVTSGQAIKIGQYVGVTVVAISQAQIDAGQDEVTVWLDGSYDLAVDGAVTAGQIVYIAGDNTLSVTATGNFPFGVANVETAGAGIAEIAPFGKITDTAALA